MAIPYDRKIIYSTYIIPETVYTDTLEEGEVKTYGTIFNVAEGGVGKALGSRSRQGEVQIAEDQGTDSWSSLHYSAESVDFDTLTWDNVPEDMNWEDYLFWFDAESIPITGPLAIRQQPVVPIKFLFIKNIGSLDLKLSFDRGVTYPIKLPAEESFSSRIAEIDSDLIMVDNDGASPSNIEFLIAK